jgi:hypothetical protein
MPLSFREYPSQIVLQAASLQLTGLANLLIASGTVRVYSLVSGSEVNALASTPLVQVGTSAVWRYIWANPELLEGQYFVEIFLTDSSGTVYGPFQDDLEVYWSADANQETLSGTENTLTKYDAGGNAKIVFDTFNEDGDPSVSSVFSRIPD